MAGFKTDGYVRNTNLLNQEHVTMSAWVRLASLPAAFHPICGFMQSPGSAVLDKDLVVFSTGLLDFQLYDGATKQITSTTVMAINRWYHVVATADGTTMKLFLNGKLESSAAAGNSYTGYTGSGTFFVSGHGTRTDTTTRYMDGQIADVCMWTEALSEGQVKELYAGSPYNRVWPASPGVPAIWWPLLRAGSPQFDRAVAVDGSDHGAVTGTVWSDPQQIAPGERSISQFAEIPFAIPDTRIISGATASLYTWTRS